MRTRISLQHGLSLSSATVDSSTKVVAPSIRGATISPLRPLAGVVSGKPQEPFQLVDHRPSVQMQVILKPKVASRG